MSWLRGAGVSRAGSLRGQLAPARAISSGGFMGPTCCLCRWWVSQHEEAAAAGMQRSPHRPAGEHRKDISIPRQGPCHPA